MTNTTKRARKSSARTPATIAERILEARHAAGLTAMQLAIATESDQTHVSRWCNGSAVPSADKAVRIAAACGVTLDWLLAGIGPMSRAV